MRRFKAYAALLLTAILTLCRTGYGYSEGDELTVVDSVWGTRAQPRRAYPGTEGNLLTVLIRNDLDESVTSVTGYLLPPKGFTGFYGEILLTDVWSGLLAPGDTITLSYRVNINSTVKPGGYSIQLNLEYTLQDGSEDSTIEWVDIFIDPIPEIRFRVAGVYWGSPENPYIAVPGSRDLTLTVEIVNLGNYHISELTASLRLPPEVESLYGHGVSVDSITNLVAGGGLARLTFRGLSIRRDASPGIYGCRLDLEYLFDLEGFTVEQGRELTVELTVSGEPATGLSLASTHWTHNGQATVVFPGSRGVSLHLTFVNLDIYDVSASKVEVQAPKGFKLLRVYGGLFNPTPGGASSTLILDFNITDRVKPGRHLVNLTLLYVTYTGGGGVETEARFQIPVYVENPDGVDTVLELTSAYWGSPGSLRSATPGSRYIPLTVELMNRGFYSASSMVLDYALPDGFKPSYGLPKAAVRGATPPGGVASSTINLDVDLDVQPGLHEFKVYVRYRVGLSGAVFERVKLFSFKLPVEEETGSSYFKVSSVGWADGRPVYPGVEEAELVIVLVNRAAYPVSGVSAELHLPEGFTGEHGSRAVVLHEPGRIPRWGELRLSVELNVAEDVAPGVYEAELRLSFTLESGGLGVETVEEHIIKIEVRPVKGVDFVQSLWYGAGAGPGDVGARLLVFLRNTGIHGMSGIVGLVEMPEGFIIPLTGNRTAKLTPSTVTAKIPLTGVGVIPAEAPIQLQPQTSASKGDYIGFLIPLNISLSLPTGAYRFNITLSFLDQWGSLQEVKIECMLQLLGSVKLILVEPSSTLLMIGEANRMSLKLVNVGTAPAYDVYIGIAGLPPGVSVKRSLFHLPVLEAGGWAEVETEAYVNPDVQYRGPLTGLAFVAFKDVYGVVQNYNQTFPITVRGRIDFQVMSITVSPSPAYKGAIVIVSGIILNRGREAARHVSVSLLENPAIKLLEGSSQYVGDVDPDTQVPFTVEAQVESGVGSYNLTLRFSYVDEYGEEYHTLHGFRLEVGEPPEAEAPTFEETVYRYLPVGLAAVFLLAVGYLIVRYVRRASGGGG